ncbi:nascent polypeptide-associated complex subunit alpha, muscle-specific form-like [Schistocerca americana]|uniref:nascent polypeptide-associated complex subunit alpha, muscle-specific form-like n=1 Tax=Schistocerca americana TaxID=7009 RepID=UPI001F4FCBAD|nr:nascent polypeptide-associated complex subunit alpha, muscle-specific form-like [Schistocerca americana]
MPCEQDHATQAQGVADRCPAGLARATEPAPSAAPSGPPRTTTQLPTMDYATAQPRGISPLTPEQVYLVVHRLSRGNVYPEYAADERALRLFQQHLRSLGCVVYEEARVPSGALPGVPNEDGIVLPVAAPMSVAPPGPVTEETGALLTATPVSSSEETTYTPIAVPPGVTTEDVTVLPRDSMIPEANLGDLIEGTDMDTSQPSRKRPAASEEDESSAISDSDFRRSQRKKMPEAPAPSEAEKGTDDGFVVPKRRHTARAKRLETVQPLPTANAFVDVPDEQEAMDAAEAPKRRAPAPPPITVSWTDTYQSFLEKFQAVTSSAKIKCAGRDLYRVWPAAGPSAGQSAVAPPTALPRRQVVPAAAPLQRQAPLPAATQRAAGQSARAFPAPPARAADQPPAAAPDLASPKDFPEPRWRRPTAPRHTVGARQDGGQMETNARHVVGGNAANEARVERMLSCMETMMQQMTELLAVVQKVASAIHPCSHHA